MKKTITRFAVLTLFILPAFLAYFVSAANAATKTFSGKLTASLVNSNEDHAGIQDVFGPGIGLNGQKEDWGFQIQLTIDGKGSKYFKSFEIIPDQSTPAVQSNPEIGWSTSGATTTSGSKYYPLVVMFNDSQINDRYADRQAFGQVAGSPVVYSLFGQKESREWKGGTITIKFTDGTQVSAYIPVQSYAKIHVLKYLDGVKAVSGKVPYSYIFPMMRTYTAANLKGGYSSIESYILGVRAGGASEAYAAEMSKLQAPFDYSTYEITDTDYSRVVSKPELCATGKFLQDGYKTSEISYTDALTHSKVNEVDFKGLTSDRYIVVFNKTCPKALTGPAAI